MFIPIGFFAGAGATFNVGEDWTNPLDVTRGASEGANTLTALGVLWVRCTINSGDSVYANSISPGGQSLTITSYTAGNVPTTSSGTISGMYSILLSLAGLSDVVYIKYERVGGGAMSWTGRIGA